MNDKVFVIKTNCNLLWYFNSYLINLLGIYNQSFYIWRWSEFSQDIIIAKTSQTQKVENKKNNQNRIKASARKMLYPCKWSVM